MSAVDEKLICDNLKIKRYKPSLASEIADLEEDYGREKREKGEKEGKKTKKEEKTNIKNKCNFLKEVGHVQNK